MAKLTLEDKVMFLLLEWENAIERRDREDSIRSTGTTEAMRAMANELREIMEN